MNIAIEAFALSDEKITGIGNVVIHYIEQLRRLDTKNRYLVYTIDGLRHVSLHGNWRHILYDGPTRRARNAIRRMWQKQNESRGFVRRAAALILRVAKIPIVAADEIYFIFWLADSLRKHRIDVYVGTSAEFFPLLVPKGIRTIWILYDLVWKLYPSTTRRRPTLSRFLRRRNLNGADLLVAISEATKRDAVSLLGVRTRIEAVPLAADADVFYRAPAAAVRAVKKKYGIHSPYILSVCTIEPRKNIAALIAAFGMLADAERYRLVLVGMSGWKNSELYRTANEHRLANRIILTGYVPSEDLAPLYSGAECFVYPSLYEGFGLPILEAMQCGCPVIASNVSSLPEVAGDACILVDPHDPDGLAREITRVLSSPLLRRSMMKKGMERARAFSWETSARRLLDLIQNTGGRCAEI